jgi:hypothetical protein
MLTLIATTLGIVLTVLNLVAFVREKDRGHLRIALGMLFLIGAVAALVTLPRYAPGPARQLAVYLPSEQLKLRWLNQGHETVVSGPSTPVQGSFTIETRHNMFGGISGFAVKFGFSEATGTGARVLGYRMRIQEEQGQDSHSFERILPESLALTPGQTTWLELDLEPEIVDALLQRMDAENPGSIEVIWNAVDASGRSFSFSSTNNAVE